MRMWKVSPRFLCNSHLRGEHVELHMLYTSLKNGKSINGYLKKNLLEPQNLRSRHDRIVTEMLRRGMKHDSPIGVVDFNVPKGYVSYQESIKELLSRCERCAELINMHSVFGDK